MVEQVIIVGAGPAGLAAAIQLKRYGVQAKVFERKKAGGLLHNANLVENYPGFPQGISGPELVDLFVRQAENLSIVVTHEAVMDISYVHEIFTVKTEHNLYQSRIMVIATGTRPFQFRGLDIPPELTDRVFYEVYDLLQLDGKRVAIVGSGDAAFDYALNLSKKNQVVILNRGSTPKCLPLLWERANKVASIKYHDRILICQLRENPSGGLWLDCQSEAGELQFQADYLLVAIGREAQLDCLSGEFQQQVGDLSREGVLYMIGDVKNGMYRQASIAVGDGIMAAMKIYQRLQEGSS